MKNVYCLALLLSIMFATLGCNKPGDHPKTYPTRITILKDGKPVEGATLSLVPMDPNNKNSAYGLTDANGVCNVTSFETGDGAVPGEYTVTVRKVEEVREAAPTEENPEDTKVVSTTEIVPKKYNSSNSSGLKITVSESGDNTAEFNVD